LGTTELDRELWNYVPDDIKIQAKADQAKAKAKKAQEEANTGGN
jgi:hypothetical protein